MSWVETTFRRAELFKAVWEEPTSTVAQRYGLSGVGLAKICRKLCVPLPCRGHWAKKAAGKSVRQPRLPSLSEGEVDVHVSRTWRIGSEGELPGGMVATASFDHVAVPEDLTQAHPLVANARRVLSGSAVASLRLRPEETCLDLRVSRESLERSLRIMQGLVVALEQLGMAVELEPAPYRRAKSADPPARTLVRIGDETVGIVLLEETRMRTVPGAPPEPEEEFARRAWRWKHVKKVATGRLILSCGAWTYGRQQRVSDGKAKPVELRLAKFLRLLVREAEARAGERVVFRRQEELRQEEERRREEAERRRRHAAMLVEDLLQRTAHLEEARAIRRLVSSVRDRAGHAADRAWIAWAEARAVALEQKAVDALPDLDPDAGQRQR